MKTKELFRRRRAKWGEDNPDISNTLKHCEDLTGIGLKQALQHYIRVEKRDEDDSDENVRQYGRIDPVVFEWTMEIDRRLAEDSDLAKDLPDPNKAREINQRIIKKELENALGTTEGGSSPTLVLIDRQALDEEQEIANNPARAYEQSMKQQLQRQMNRELQRAFAPKRSRVKIEEDTISEELDTEPTQKEPTGKYKDVVAVAEQEIISAMNRLLPIDNGQIAEKHREEFDRYIAENDDDQLELPVKVINVRIKE